MTDEKWYRYDDPYTDGNLPFLTEIPVLRHTPKGVWLDKYGLKRFVLKAANKRYAYPTKELALASYIIRKQRQIQHAAAAHDRAKKNLDAAQRFARGEEPKPQSYQLHRFGLLI